LIENTDGRRLRHRWEDAIEVGPREMVCDVDWINVAQVKVQWQTLVNKWMNHWIALKVGK
jgi:hypothetical protein